MCRCWKGVDCSGHLLFLPVQNLLLLLMTKPVCSLLISDYVTGWDNFLTPEIDLIQNRSVRASHFLGYSDSHKFTVTQTSHLGGNVGSDNSNNS